MSIIELKHGQKGRIIEIKGMSGLKKKLESIGLRVGSQVLSISGALQKGPLIVQSGSTQIAIGRGMASKIIIEAVN